MPAPLFSPFVTGQSLLNNRVAMAPMTRSRAQQPGDVPTEMNARYYAQRASAGLIITEGTQISPAGKGYSFTPGIYSREQLEGWRVVTEAVHQKGGLIAAQLWHVGRMSHHTLQENGDSPLSPSDVQANAAVFVVNEDSVGEMVQADKPKPMTQKDILTVKDQFVKAAKNARLAGFDFVEIHAANGYLFDQFLDPEVNLRSDRYGGSLENRARFLLETLDAIIDEVGSDFVGVRLSPWCNINGMNNEPKEDMTLYLAGEFQQRNIAWLHLAEWAWAGGQPYPDGFRQSIRQTFRNTLIVCGGYDVQSAQERIQEGTADVIAFGRPFIANPDLVARMRNGSSLAEADKGTFYGGNEKGYTDYPASV